MEFPKRVTQRWIEENCPSMSEETKAKFIELLTNKGWTEQDLNDRVHPHLNGEAVKNVAEEAKPKEISKPTDVEETPAPGVPEKKETVEGIRVLNDLFPVR